MAAPGQFWGGGVFGSKNAYEMWFWVGFYWAADEKEEKKKEEKKEKKEGTINKYRGPSMAKICSCLCFFNQRLFKKNARLGMVSSLIPYLLSKQQISFPKRVKNAILLFLVWDGYACV